MKAEELMIGDLVLYQDEAIRVEHIYNNGYGVVVGEKTYEDLDYLSVGYNTRIVDITIDEVFPIPLTAEILEANEFLLDHGFYTIKNVIGAKTMVRYTEQDEEHCHPHFLGHWVLDESYIVDNVHELQHALRLCGLSDEANNFKIE